jgi:hypothetical protein
MRATVMGAKEPEKTLADTSHALSQANQKSRLKQNNPAISTTF